MFGKASTFFFDELRRMSGAGVHMVLCGNMSRTQY
jgi:hypothetical protein